MKATTVFGYHFTRDLDILVCGFETVSLHQGSELSFLFNRGSGDQVILSSLFQELFASSRLECPITEF